MELYLTDEIIVLIVTETKRFANQYLGSNPNKSDLGKNLATEIKTLIVVFPLTGIIYKPQRPMYWSTTTRYTIPIFAKLMNRNRILFPF